MKNIVKNLIFSLSLLFIFLGIVNFSEAQIAPATGSPDIISYSVSNITTNSAILDATIKANGLGTSVSFELSNGTIYPQNTKKISGFTNTKLNPFTISGLKDGTNYSFRVIANNSMGTDIGNWTNFTTAFISNPTPPPTPTTNAPTIISSTISNITTNSAVFNVTIKANGLATCLSYEDGNGKIYQIKKSVTGYTNVNLDPINLTGFNPSTNYSFRFIAANSNGTTYGSWVPFSTLSNNNGGGGGGGSSGGGGGYVYVVPSTLNASSVNTNSAILNGTVITHNLKTEAWFEYSTSSNFAMTYKTPAVSLSSNSNTTPFSLTIANLSPNTTYYFRAYAQGPTGTKYGNILSFTTLPISIVNNNTNNTTNNTVKKNNSVSVKDTSKKENLETEKDIKENQSFNQNNLTANTLNSAYLSFLPSTFIGWLTLTLIIFAILLLIKEILKTFKRKSKEKSADDIDNLPM
jgi:hypothetical protein